jgi:hypothetical protein
LCEQFLTETEQELNAALAQGVNPHQEYLVALGDLVRWDAPPAQNTPTETYDHQGQADENEHQVRTRPGGAPAAFGRIAASTRFHAAATLQTPAIVACRTDV